MNPILDIPTLIIIVVRLAIGVQLLGTAKANPLMKNIRWLAIFYLAMTAANCLSLTFVNSSLAGEVLRNIVASIAYLPLALFIFQTFYSGKRVTGWFLIGSTTVFALASLVYSVLALGGSRSTLIMAFSFSGMLPLVLWFWHAWAAARAFGKIRKENLVEDWVKWRYKAMVTYSGLHFAGGIVGSMSADPALIAYAVPIGSVISLVSIVLQYLVWVAPESFRKYLNRNYKAPEQVEFEELSEEELMAQMIKS
jgi:hypothetical protein